MQRRARIIAFANTPSVVMQWLIIQSRYGAGICLIIHRRAEKIVFQTQYCDGGIHQLLQSGRESTPVGEQVVSCMLIVFVFETRYYGRGTRQLECRHSISVVMQWLIIQSRYGAGQPSHWRCMQRRTHHCLRQCTQWRGRVGPPQYSAMISFRTTVPMISFSKNVK